MFRLAGARPVAEGFSNKGLTVFNSTARCSGTSHAKFQAKPSGNFRHFTALIFPVILACDQAGNPVFALLQGQKTSVKRCLITPVPPEGSEYTPPDQPQAGLWQWADRSGF